MAANDAIPATNAKGATDQNTVGTERKSKSPYRFFKFRFIKDKVKLFCRYGPSLLRPDAKRGWTHQILSPEA